MAQKPVNNRGYPLSFNLIVDTGAGASLIKLKNLKDTLKVDDNDLIMLKGINEFRIPTLGSCKIELNFKIGLSYRK